MTIRIRTATAIAAYIAVSAALSFSPYRDWQEQRRIEYQRTVDIYEKPWAVQWGIENDTLIFTAISKKLEPCVVEKGRSVTINVQYDMGLAHYNSRTYDAKFTDGGKVVTGPQVTAGDEFIVGPFKVEDSPQVIDRAVSAQVILSCQFLDTKVTREAVIGPIPFIEVDTRQ